MKKIVITGVSSGIGFASAKILCNAGYKVYGSVRNNEDANKVQNQLGVNFEPLIFDVTDAQSILNSAIKVKNELRDNEYISALDMINFHSTFKNLLEKISKENNCISQIFFSSFQSNIDNLL